jgi:hypothetical protein
MTSQINLHFLADQDFQGSLPKLIPCNLSNLLKVTYASHKFFDLEIFQNHRKMFHLSGVSFGDSATKHRTREEYGKALLFQKKYQKNVPVCQLRSEGIWCV